MKVLPKDHGRDMAILMEYETSPAPRGGNQHVRRLAAKYGITSEQIRHIVSAEQRIAVIGFRGQAGRKW